MYSALAVDTSGYPHISYYAGSFTGEYTSVALDPAGNPHAAYYDWTNSNLKYAKYNGASWELQTVDPTNGTGKHASIALDGFGYPHISYFDNVYGDLRYAKWTGSSWDIQIVDGIGDVGEYTSIKIDSSSRPHIAYYDYTNGDLKYANWTGTAWSSQTIDSNGEVGRFCSLALDSSNNPHISYLDESTTSLKYAKFNGAAWSKDIVDSAGVRGWFTSIALDSNDKPHISYFDWANGYLRYATKSGASWSTSIVDNTSFAGEYTSIALDSADKPYISYYDVTNCSLKCAKNTTGAWTKETVDTNNTGRYSSIAVNRANGNIHISYFDSKNFDLKYAKYNGSWSKSTLDGTPSDLKYAKKTGGSWSVQSVDSTDDKGEYTSIALDRGNNVHISYFDWTSNDLRYLNWAQSIGWKSPVPVDFSGDLGQYSSVALDPSGYPHVSYYDLGNGDLKYARYNGASWAYETVYSTNDSGSYSSLALDANGYPHISFYDYTEGDLKYAYKDGSGWHYEVVDSTPDTGLYTSIAITEDGYPRISYYDWDNGDLKYAKKSQSGWSREIVDGTGDAGWHTSLELDSVDSPHIAYYDWTNGALKYASYNGSAWELQTVDDTGNSGEFCSLALDRYNGAHISYIDWDSFNLKYAYFQGSTAAYSINGYIKDSSGGGISGASVILSGHGDGLYVTAPGGYYEFPGVVAGNYQVSVNKTGYIFSPMNYIYQPLNSSRANQNFTGTQSTSPVTFSIKGYARFASGAGISGAAVSLSGKATANCSTQPDGYYEFLNLSTGSYTVTPSKSGCVFVPSNYSYSTLYSDLTGQNFTGSTITYYIKGYVKDSTQQGISGVTVTAASGAQAAGAVSTDSNGYYEFLNLEYNGSYTITPAKTGWAFNPVNKSYTPLDANKDDQNFTGTAAARLYRISGYVRNSAGTELEGVSLALSGLASGTLVTDSSGYFEVSGLADGSYLVRPSKTGWSFNPSDLIIDVDSNKDNNVFTGMPGTPGQAVNYCKPGNNLFNPHKREMTTIWYNLLSRGAVKMKLYTVDGRLVKSLVDETKDPGLYTEQWNGANEGGEIAGRGVYILYYQAPGIKEKKKIILSQ